MTSDSFKVGTRHAIYSLTVWPVTSCYLAGVAALALVAGDMVNLIPALILFGVAAALIALLALLREVRTVHFLVNSQHDALVARISQLVDSLMDAGVTVPTTPSTAVKTGHVT